MAGHDGGVDAVDEHEAAALWWRLVGIDEDAPGGSATKAPPRHLGRGVSDGEADSLDGGYEGAGFVDLKAPASLEVVGAHEGQPDGSDDEAAVDHCRVAGCEGGHDGGGGEGQVGVAGYAPPGVVGEHVGADHARDVEVGGQLVGVLVSVFFHGATLSNPPGNGPCDRWFRVVSPPPQRR